MDGGYYAIKGFEYQIDKNILEILQESDEDKCINIEQNQDLDADDFVMQVKYKETAKFVPSAIKEPVLQLLTEFQKDSGKKYYLYCYFKDFNGYKEDIKIDSILGNVKDQYSTVVKEQFEKNFEIKFAPDYEMQLSQTIGQIKALGYDEENAIIHHARLTKYLRDLVVKNNPDDISKRTCTRKDLVQLIKDDLKITFTYSYRLYKGQEKYFQKLRKDYFTSRNVDKFFRIIIIELNGIETLADIKTVCIGIRNKFYKVSQSEVKGEAPFIYLLNIKEELLAELKATLLEEGQVVKDGFDFFRAPFNINTISVKSTKANLISIRFINDETILERILHLNLRATKEVYQFYSSKPLRLVHNSKEVDIQVDQISELLKII